MGRRSKVPELAQAEALSRAVIEAEIDRLRLSLKTVSNSGAAFHVRVRLLSRWEGVLQNRFGVERPRRPNRNT